MVGAPTVCRRNASTSSRQRRLATRLGEMSCRERVRVVKATSPDTASPDNTIQYTNPHSLVEYTANLTYHTNHHLPWFVVFGRKTIR